MPGAWLGKFQTLFLQTAHITDGQSGPGETDCEAGFLLTNMPLDSGSLRECAGDFSGSCPSKNLLVVLPPALRCQKYTVTSQETESRNWPCEANKLGW